MTITIEKDGTLFRARATPPDSDMGAWETPAPMDLDSLVAALRSVGCHPIDIGDAIAACDPLLVPAPLPDRVVRLRNPARSIVVTRDGEKLRAAYTAEGEAGPTWVSPQAMTPEALMEELRGQFLHPVDIWAAMAACDPQIFERLRARAPPK